MKNQLSCIFSYEKRVFDRDGQPIFLEDGKTVRTNWNFISYLQVISAYWEMREDGKSLLNVFLNGGSIVEDRNSGERISKAGFTVVMPEFIGVRFMQEFSDWSFSFGLAAPPSAARSTPHSTHTRSGNSRPRSVREDAYVNPEEVALVDASWEPAV